MAEFDDATYREFQQFEKRFDDYREVSRLRDERMDRRFDRLEGKIDQIPWILLAIAVNLVISVLSILLK